MCLLQHQISLMNRPFFTVFPSPYYDAPPVQEYIISLQSSISCLSRSPSRTASSLSLSSSSRAASIYFSQKSCSRSSYTIYSLMPAILSRITANFSLSSSLTNSNFTCVESTVPTDAATKIIQFLLGSRTHYNIMMLPYATNKPALPQQTANRLSQPDLHAKILSLVAHRMQPTSPSLILQKQACGSCVAPSPAASTKRNSLAATRTREKPPRGNQTVCDGYSSLNQREEREKRQVAKKGGSGNSTHLTQDFLIRHARKMTIESKVVSMSIDHTKIGDFTIDLRKEMPTEFVNVKKLRQENAEKQRRITQLESEVLELHERIIEMSLNLQHCSKESSSEGQIPSSMNTISEIAVNKGQPENSLAVDPVLSQFQPRGRESEENHYQSLLRMIKMQAKEIEKYHQNLPKNPQRGEKDKRYSYY